MSKKKKKANKDLSDKDFKDELKLLYSLCVSDIAFAKSEQWKITNYTVAIFGALFAIWKTIIIDHIDNRFGIEFYIIILLGLVVLILGIKMILIDQSSLNRARQRIRAIVDEFSDEFKLIFNQIELKKHKRKIITVLLIHLLIIILSYLMLIYSVIMIN